MIAMLKELTLLANSHIKFQSDRNDGLHQKCSLILKLSMKDTECLSMKWSIKSFNFAQSTLEGNFIQTLL